MFQLPAITSDHLQLVYVCVHLDREREPVEIGPDEDLAAKVHAGSKGNDDVYAIKTVSTTGNTQHYHVEIGVESAIGVRPKRGSLKRVLTPPQALRGRTSLASIGGRFRILRSQLPENNFIRILWGISLPTTEYHTALSGGEFEFVGKGPLRQVRWDSVSDKELELRIIAYAPVVIDDQVFLEARKIVEEGLSHVVPEVRKTRKRERRNENL